LLESSVNLFQKGGIKMFNEILRAVLLVILGYIMGYVAGWNWANEGRPLNPFREVKL